MHQKIKNITSLLISVIEILKNNKFEKIQLDLYTLKICN